MNNTFNKNPLKIERVLFVRMIGVEPTWITPPDPKSGASANFATSGFGIAKVGNFGKSWKRFVFFLN
jgi:hypothetical protein